ncbi:MAG: carbohydrate kinase [Pseudomonadota bacterium]|nr:carbohydrate kinase [Pseudomonadota bacterium]
MYLVCGEALYDVFVGPPAADARGKVSLFAKVGGSPYNVAIGLSRLGCATSLAAEIASDTLGRNLESRLQTEGVDCQFIRRTAKSTALAMVDVDSTGVPRYAFYGLDQALFHPDIAAVRRQWKSLFGIHVGSIPIVSSQSSDHLFELVTAAPDRILISFDPNVRLAIEPRTARWRDAVDRFGRYAHLIKFSEEDLTHLYGTNIDIDAIAKRWLAYRCSLVVVTRGDCGASIFSRSTERIDIAPVHVVIADTVGAGDSFQSAMLAWLADNHRVSPQELAALSAGELLAMGRFAARAAAATCRHRGPEFPSRKALGLSDDRQ